MSSDAHGEEAEAMNCLPVSGVRDSMDRESRKYTLEDIEQAQRSIDAEVARLTNDCRNQLDAVRDSPVFTEAEKKQLMAGIKSAHAKAVLGVLKDTRARLLNLQ